MELTSYRTSLQYPDEIQLPGGSVKPLSMNVFKSVLELENMRSFKISHPRPLLLDHEDFDNIAKSWPLIEVLELNPYPVVGLYGPMRVLSLSHIDNITTFGELCPNLRRLAICVSVDPEDHIGDGEDGPGTDRFGESFRELDIDNSPMTTCTPKYAIKFLSRLFEASPKVLIYSGSKSRPYDHEYASQAKNSLRLWNDVVEIIKGFATRMWEKNEDKI